MGMINFYAAWIGILFGFISGAIIGLFFHEDNWVGGYSSWPRRMLRLGHISFFGIAFINLTYSLSIWVFQIRLASPLSSYLFLAGAITMPLVCFLSAYKKDFRHFFAVPVISLVAGAMLFVIHGFVK